MAYVLGYFAADGAMSINTHGAKYVSFSSTDIVLLEHVKKLLKAEHAIRLKTRTWAKAHWKPIFQLQIGGGELFEQLARLGFTPKKDTSMLLPQVPATCFSGFVRGYFDGDGCISYGWYRCADRPRRKFWIQALFTSGSFEFLRQLDARIHVQVGITPGYLRGRPDGCYLYYQRRGDLRMLCDFLYPRHLSAEEFLPRKRDRFIRALAISRGRISIG